MKRNPIRLTTYGALTLAMMLLIFFLSSQDGSESGGLSLWLMNTRFGRILLRILPPLTDEGASLDIRKYAHLAEYMALAFFSAQFFREIWLEKLPQKAMISSGLFVFLYACLDEIHQTHVPGRSGQFSDVIIDMCGALIGILFVFLISILRRERT